MADSIDALSPAAVQGESRMLSRKERERLMRRDSILDAALAVFAEKGYRSATLDEVAERAEFGKGTLYNYFPSGKEGLLFAIFDDVTSGIERIAESTFAPDRLGDASFRSMLTDFVAHLVAYSHSRRDLFLVLLKEANRMALGDDQEKVRYFQAHHNRLVAVLLPAVEHSMEKGELRRVSPHAAVEMVLGNIDGYIRHRCYEQNVDGSCSTAVFTPLTPEEAAAFITSLLLDGLATSRTVFPENGRSDAPSA